ncbi:hypothetical protein ACFOZ1_13790 [Gracilibacillus marinus]|jgi:gas vesicle protein|uniref:YtxH domain-containing protein n=1 Tax=Gracilibacillus marinus TaxID=630535 RepID=A0ABV8VXI0_9BACI
MGKKLLIRGMVIGALAGGALSLLDKDTRNYVNIKCKQTQVNVKYYAKHPSQFVQMIQSNYEKCSEQLTTGLAQTTEVLKQLENVTGKVKGNENNKRI